MCFSGAIICIGAGRTSEVALKWANLISDEEFRKTMVETVT